MPGSGGSIAASFQPLADWKTSRGTRTVVVTTDWIDAAFPSVADATERVGPCFERKHRVDTQAEHLRIGFFELFQRTVE